MSRNAEQPGLELWPREHDLPPRWDGLPIEWDQWREPPTVFLCPPPRQPEHCDHCGSTAPQSMSIGRIWTDPATAPPAISRARMRRGRHLVGIITAFRCDDCTHDTVLDPSGVLWDLDITDYSDEGSWDTGARPHAGRR